MMLFLSRFSAWDLRWETTANFFMCCGAVLLIISQLKRNSKLLRAPVAAVWYFLVSFVLFSFAPFENWLWSWQMPYFLIQVCVLLLTGTLASFPRSVLSWCVAIGVAVIASLSFATGMALWFAGLVELLLVAPRQKLVRSVLVWLLAASSTVSLYLIDYEFLLWNDPVSAVARMSHFLGYVLVYLGAALVPTHWVRTSAVLGLIYLTLLFALLTFALRAPARVRLAVAPFLGWMSFALGAGLLTAAGRSNVHDFTQAMSPRYITFTQLGWLGGVLAIDVWRLVNCGQTQRRRLAVPLFALQVLIGLGFCMAYIHGLQGMRWLSREIRSGYVALTTTRELARLRKLYVVPEQLRDEFLPLMQKYRLGPFHETHN